MSSDPTRYPPADSAPPAKANYLEELKLWGIRSAVVLALTVAVALINRYLGVSVEVPPPPVIVVEGAPPADPTAADYPPGTFAGLSEKSLRSGYVVVYVPPKAKTGVIVRPNPEK